MSPASTRSQTLARAHRLSILAPPPPLLPSLTKQEEQLALIKLQACLFPKIHIVRSGRRLVLRGDLIKIAAKDETEQKYHFFLFNDVSRGGGDWGGASNHP